MVNNNFIEVLNFKPALLAARWKDLIRKSPQLRHYNALSDDELIELNTPVYAQIARSIERGIDKSVLGDFFVKFGKEMQAKGFPVSETVFACNLNQKMLVDFSASEVMDNHLALYQTMQTINNVNEFFFLGLFYMIKGFLEKTYTNLNKKHNISEETLKEYFMDDFFFKQEAD
jgi:hypothetical protein